MRLATLPSKAKVQPACWMTCRTELWSVFTRSHRMLFSAPLRSTGPLTLNELQSPWAVHLTEQSTLLLTQCSPRLVPTFRKPSWIVNKPLFICEFAFENVKMLSVTKTAAEIMFQVDTQPVCHVFFTNPKYIRFAFFRRLKHWTLNISRKSQFIASVDMFTWVFLIMYESHGRHHKILYLFAYFRKKKL